MNADDIRSRVKRFETCIHPDDRDIFHMGMALADVYEAAKSRHAALARNLGHTTENCGLCAALARVEALPP